MSLYAITKYNTLAELRELLNGPPVPGASGTLGTNLVTSPNLGVPAASGDEGDFTDLVVGDRIIIEGESLATVLLILTKTDDQNVILDNNIAAAHTANAVWRALRQTDVIPVAKIQFGGPLESANQAWAGIVVYDQS